MNDQYNSKIPILIFVWPRPPLSAVYFGDCGGLGYTSKCLILYLIFFYNNLGAHVGNNEKFLQMQPDLNKTWNTQ